ncbi:hypothetical protein, partial [Streptomyces purpurogeneiscleroticus]|uniref:hypothetical protein n=1 Tax=Streptomyces purpurogeneiscleroticus TaxID=68259 RepID=UPI001CBBFCD6
MTVSRASPDSPDPPGNSGSSLGATLGQGDRDSRSAAGVEFTGPESMGPESMGNHPNSGSGDGVPPPPLSHNVIP